MDFFVNHNHYEDFLLSIWSHNPEFARHHSDYPPSVLAPPFTPVTPFVPSVWLGSLTLHPVYPKSPDPSTPKSPSPFSGNPQVFCPWNYSPRSKCQGRTGVPFFTPLFLPSLLVRQGIRHPKPSQEQVAAELQGSEDMLNGRGIVQGRGLKAPVSAEV